MNKPNLKLDKETSEDRRVQAVFSEADKRAAMAFTGKINQPGDYFLKGALKRLRALDVRKFFGSNN